MIDILIDADEEILSRELHKLNISSFNNLGQHTKRQRASFIISYYGFDFFREAGMRHAILSAIPLDELKNLAKSLKLQISNNLYEQSLIISRQKWNKSNPFSEIFRDLVFKLYKYRIPIEYLPESQIYKKSSLNEVYAETLPPLFDYQLDISNKILSVFKKKSSRGMVQMPTGSGKTRTTMSALISWIRGNYEPSENHTIIWMAHTEELCEQAIETFERSWLTYGEGTFRYYRYFGGRKIDRTDLNGGIVFCTLQKLYSAHDNDNNIFNYLTNSCSILIFDEAHKALAVTYKFLIDKITLGNKQCSLIGLSATPGRGTDPFENKRLAKLFNNRLIKYNFGQDSIKALRKMGILASIKRKEIPGTHDFQLTSQDLNHIEQFHELPGSVLKNIGQDTNRNSAIVSEIQYQVKKGNQVILFSCSVEHAKLLAALIALDDISASAITSDMRKITRSKIIAKFKNGDIDILTNFGILTTGFDAPNVGAVFITRPTQSAILYSQMIGRGLRGPKVGGRKSCILIDVVDNISGFGDQSKIYNKFSDYW